MKNLEAPIGGDINRGTQFIVIAVVFGALSTLTTAIRVTVRTIKRQFGYDDLAVTLATGLMLIEVIFNGLEYYEGAGRHAFYLTERQRQRSLMWNYVTQYLLFLIICITKIGICLFILRIKDTGWLRWCLYALMSGLVLTTLPCIIILSAQCRPLWALWIPEAGTCWSRNVYNDAIWAQVAYSIFSDLVCSLLPVVVLWNVQVSKHLKVAVCGLMSVGLLATGSAAVRASLSGNNKSEDLTWALNEISIWGALEENFAIIGANLAVSRAIYVYVRDLRQSARRESKYPQRSYLGDGQLRPATGWHRNIYASSKSQDSVIPLEDSAIKKTTDLSVVREPRPGLHKIASNLDFDGRTFLVEDQV
ncbi:MAG: hypothetical protein Q9182_004967 [Xanthomendoza sp. 2 TL-2023]